jgi:hypothetical protein
MHPITHKTRTQKSIDYEMGGADEEGGDKGRAGRVAGVGGGTASGQSRRERWTNRTAVNTEGFNRRIRDSVETPEESRAPKPCDTPPNGQEKANSS